MHKRFNDNNFYFEDDYCFEKKCCDNCCYPSYINNQVMYNVGVNEAGQLILTLNGID